MQLAVNATLLAGALSFLEGGSGVESQEATCQEGSSAHFQQTQFVTRVQNFTVRPPGPTSCFSKASLSSTCSFPPGYYVRN